MLIGGGVKVYADKYKKSYHDVPLWFYELHAIPQWHHDKTKCGNLAIKPDWCLTDHADCVPYVFGWCLGDKPGQGVVPDPEVTHLTKYFIKRYLKDCRLSREMISEWTNFAKEGKPSWSDYRTETKIFNNGATATLAACKEKDDLLEILLYNRMDNVYTKF